MNQPLDTAWPRRKPIRQLRVYEYVCSRTTAAAATGYRQDMTALLRRNGVVAQRISVDNGSCLDSLLETIDQQDDDNAVIMVPSLDHLDGRLAEVATHVTVWTMYPPQWWDAEQPA